MPFLLGSNLFHSDAIAKQSNSDTFRDTKLHIIDIGKGQSLILKHGCSVSLLDAGGEMKFLEHYLEKLKLVIDESSQELAIDAISLVAAPAIEENFVYMNKTKIIYNINLKRFFRRF